MSHAISWLEYELWYVGMAVLEGGVGGLLGMKERLDIGAAAQNFGIVEGFDRES
jgi:hypothetical protein